MNGKILALATFLIILTKVNANRQCHGFGAWHDDSVLNFTKFIAHGQNIQVCLAIVKSPELHLAESQISCREHFPAGQPLMIKGEHYIQLKNDYEKNLHKTMWIWGKQKEVFFFADFVHYPQQVCERVKVTETSLHYRGILKTDTEPKCSIRLPYVCQYPFLYNCAWHVQDTEVKDGENVKFEQKIFYDQQSDYDHDKFCGFDKFLNHLADDVKVALKQCTPAAFRSEWTQWSLCGATCTNPFASSPARFRVRSVTVKCAETVTLNATLKIVILYETETCNVHVLCPDLNITTFAWAPTTTNADMIEETEEPENTTNVSQPESPQDIHHEDYENPTTPNGNSVITVAIVMVALIFAVAIVTVAAVIVKRKISAKKTKNAENQEKSENMRNSPDKNVASISVAKTIMVHPAGKQSSVFAMKSTQTLKSAKANDDYSCLSLPPLSVKQDIYTIVRKNPMDTTLSARKQ